MLNALRGGDPDETISSTIGKVKLRHNGRIPWTHPIAKILDKVLDFVDPSHSVNSIEYDEGKSVKTTWTRKFRRTSKRR